MAYSKSSSSLVVIARVCLFAPSAGIFISVVELSGRIFSEVSTAWLQHHCSWLLAHGFERLRFGGGVSTPICLLCGWHLKQKHVRITPEENVGNWM